MYAGMAELVDAEDLKSSGSKSYAGSIPAPGTTYNVALPLTESPKRLYRLKGQ